jgi:hypothetical protein
MDTGGVLDLPDKQKGTVVRMSEERAYARAR